MKTRRQAVQALAATGLATMIAGGLSTNALAQSSGLQIIEVEEGTGKEAVLNETVRVHYSGFLMDGTKFDSSLDRGQPFSFTLGAGQVIPGWEQGIQGMKVGGKRELIIPPELAYGERGAGASIPPNATLRFEVELLSAGPLFETIDNAKLKELLDSGVKIVDIRRPDEWEADGVIEGAATITAFDAQGRFNRRFPVEFDAFVKPNEPIIVICQRGNRSKVMAQVLTEQAGYETVYNVDAGIAGWIADGNPVVPYEKPAQAE